MTEPAVEAKPEESAEPKLDPTAGAKPEGAAPAGGGEPANPSSQPSQEPDWKKQFDDLKSKYELLGTQVPALVKGMNTAQEQAALYRQQMQALVGAQPPQADPVETWSREAEELESNYRFAEAAPIRSRITAEVARRASREEFQNLQRQQSVHSTQAQVNRILKDKYGIDPSSAGDLSARATANPEALAAAMALAHDPEAVARVAVRESEDRKKAAERASLVNTFGGGSGGRGIPGNGNPQKARMSHITYSALPSGRKEEIKAMALEGKIDLFTVTGRGAQERVEIIDPRDL